jgi:hypothetical protein
MNHPYPDTIIAGAAGNRPDCTIAQIIISRIFLSAIPLHRTFVNAAILFSGPFFNRTVRWLIQSKIQFCPE